jgi:hypothetical protein
MTTQISLSKPSKPGSYSVVYRDRAVWLWAKWGVSASLVVSSLDLNGFAHGIDAAEEEGA